MASVQSQPFKKCIRWLAVLPAALIGGYVGYLVIAAVTRFGFYRTFLDPNFWLWKVFVVGASHFALGFGFVYAGVALAPDRKKGTSIALLSIGLVLLGVFLGPALLLKNGWAIASVGFSGAGLFFGMKAALESCCEE